jgi:DNA-directed RNA polymerase subunit RPC12/RpoP|tara:strand:- start:1505 stop:1660 length:156 start_codon:yes stop_codon:yes gene_type:complete
MKKDLTLECADCGHKALFKERENGCPKCKSRKVLNIPNAGKLTEALRAGSK